ncbi:unnamed protein product, partial [Closterium sp. NIES-54]
MDLQEERYKRKASVPEFAFHTQRRYNNNNYQHQPKSVPPFCHLCKTSGHPPRLAASHFNQIRRMQPSLKASHLGTADSDGIVTFTSWTHPPDLDPNFSPEGFWYSHTIPKAERTRALATIQHSAAAEPTPAAAETTPAAAKTTSTAAETTSAAAETTAAAAVTTTPIAGPSTASAQIDDTPPTPAQQLNPTSREIHRSANFTASFYSNSDLYR